MKTRFVHAAVTLGLGAVVLFGLSAQLSARLQQSPRTAVILVQFPTSHEPYPSAAANVTFTQNVALQVDQYYAEQSYGQFTPTSDVFGIFTVPLDETATKADIAREAKAALAATGVDLAPYDRHFVYVSPTTFCAPGGGACAGYGDLTGVWIAMLSGEVRAPDFHMLAHELGHHYGPGLSHAHGTVCSDGTPLGSNGGTCAFDPYGDTLDVMGIGNGHFTAIGKWRHGWLTSANVIDVAADGEFVLTPLSVVGGTKALTVRSKTSKLARTYWVEYRQPTGYEQLAPWVDSSQQNLRGAVVHLESGSESTLLAMTPSLNPTRIDRPLLLPGQTYCDRDARVAITALAADATSLRVRVDYRPKCYGGKR